MEQGNDGGRKGVTPAMEHLLVELDRLSTSVERSNSLGRNFMKGFMTGLGGTAASVLVMAVALFGAYGYLRAHGLSSIFDAIGVDKAISSSVNKAMKDMLIKP